MTISRGNYTLKKPLIRTRTLSEAAADLGITPQKCSRIMKKIGLPIARLGYIVVLEGKEFLELKAAIQRMKKKAKSS